VQDCLQAREVGQRRHPGAPLVMAPLRAGVHRGAQTSTKLVAAQVVQPFGRNMQQPRQMEGATF
jgi:hypothetical protein